MKKLIANLSIIFAIGGFSQLPVSADGLSDGEIQATIALEPNEQGQREASLTFAASEYERTVTLVYGDEDAGARVECWPHRVVLGKVQPGSTSATFALPQEVGTNFGLVRFVFTTTGLSSSAYVQDGLVIQYDALENAGRGSYDSTIDKWKNLAAEDYSIRVRSTGNFVCTFEGTYLSIPSKTVLSVTTTDTFLPRDSAKTVESIYWIDDGSITPETGSRAYPVNVCEDAMFTARGKENTFTCATFVDAETGISYNMTGTDLARNSQEFLAQPQSYSLVYKPQPSESTMRINGEAYIEGNVTAGETKCFYSNETRDHNLKVQIGSARGEMKVSTVRVYNRALTDAERAQNYEVDRKRFFGVATPVVVVPITFTATVDRRAGKADFLFTATNLVRRLCVAWGNRDCGAAATNAWSNVADIAEVPAMAFKAESVALPSEVFEVKGYRFFLVDVYDSTSYVQDGLTFHYDALENAGRGTYDASATSWANLAPTGLGGLDLVVPAASFAGNHLAIPQNTALKKYFGSDILSRDQPKTVESVYWLDAETIPGAASHTIQLVDICHDGYFVTRCKQHQYTCSEFVDSADGYGYIMRGTDETRNSADFLAAPQTYSMVNDPAAALSSMRINGAAYVYGNATAGDSVLYAKTEKQASGHSDSITLGTSSYTVGLNVGTLRVYTRELTDEERDRNALVDRVRYCGDPAPMQASEYLRNPSGLVLLIR